MTATWVTAIASAVLALMAVLDYIVPREPGKDAQQPVRTASRHRKLRSLSIMGIAVVIAGVASYLHFHHTTKKAKASTIAATKPTVPSKPTRAEREATTSQQEAIAQQREAEARSRHARLLAQGRLKRLIRHNIVQEDIRCTANESLPEHVIAQQVCRKGGATIVYTRLDTEAATHGYWLARYENSANYVGYVGTCNGPYWPISSKWNNLQGHTEGSFAFRVSGSDVILIWEIRHQRVVIRESHAGNAGYLCQLWGEQSSKYVNGS
jgi:hypothetical protein